MLGNVSHKPSLKIMVNNVLMATSPFCRKNPTCTFMLGMYLVLKNGWFKIILSAIVKQTDMLRNQDVNIIQGRSCWVHGRILMESSIMIS